MKTKNISVNIKKGKKVPFKETYMVFNNSRSKIRIVQKFRDQTKNQSISLKINECARLLNLFTYYLFDGEFEPKIDKMLYYEEEE